MTKQILVGGVPIGGGAPVVIQSMLNTKTTDVEGSLKQIRQLASAGCQIARLAVPNMEAARSFTDICKDSPLPLVADIHFDYRLAIAAAEGGASKIRINPGNIGGEDRVKAVVEVCKDKHIPIRIGVNGGSLDKRLLEKYGHPTAEALVESAFEHLELLEKQGFHDTCVSMKSSTVPTMVAAARLFRAKCDYPLHIGVTETGPVRQGLIKSAMGIGALLLDGIGDTIRVSLTDDPVQEVYAARDILKAAGLRKDGVNIVSCPTCGRTRIDLIGLVNRVDEVLKNCEKPITVRPEELIELQSLAESRHLIYMEAILMCHLPQRGLVRQALPALGRIRSAHIDFSQLSSKYHDLMNGSLPNIFNPACCTGALMDLGVYCAYFAAYLWGMPDSIQAAASFLPTGADSTGTCILRYPDLLVTMSYAKAGQDHAGSQIQGDRGTLTLESVSRLAGIRLWPESGEPQLLWDSDSKAVMMSGEALDFWRYITDPAGTRSEYEENMMAAMRADAGVRFAGD